MSVFLSILNDKGDGLGMMWGTQKAEELLKKAGFEHIEIAEMDFDSFNVLCQASGSWIVICRAP
jgi:hypothetical protein